MLEINVGVTTLQESMHPNQDLSTPPLQSTRSIIRIMLKHRQPGEVQDYILSGLHLELPAGLSQYSLSAVRGIFIGLALEDVGLRREHKVERRRVYGYGSTLP